jgi:prepilin-type N-terminal cleavage/methylation domain-containing protein
MRADRGFTLLETVLALAIGGLVLTAAYAAVVRAAAARDGATRRTAAAADARRAVLEVTRALEAAADHPFAATADTLRIEQREPAPELVDWALADGRLVERRTPAFAAATAGEWPGRVLLAGVEAFSVRCFDGTTWVAGWHGARAPRAVELAIRTTGGEELRTRLVLPLGGGG